LRLIADQLVADQQPPAQFGLLPIAPTEEQFVTARVNVIESFARLEAEVTKIILRFDPQFEVGSSFVSKLNKLKTCASSDQVPLSPKARRHFQCLGQTIANQTKIRNDLVHGVMTIICVDHTLKAAFQNAADLARDYPQFTHLGLHELDDARKKIKNATHQLTQLANPPSPPPPSPAAATGP
jgi:hypothetical protein